MHKLWTFLYQFLTSSLLLGFLFCSSAYRAKANYTSWNTPTYGGSVYTTDEAVINFDENFANGDDISHCPEEGLDSNYYVSFNYENFTDSYTAYSVFSYGYNDYGSTPWLTQNQTINHDFGETWQSFVNDFGDTSFTPGDDIEFTYGVYESDFATLCVFKVPSQFTIIAPPPPPEATSTIEQTQTNDFYGIILFLTGFGGILWTMRRELG